MHLSKINVDMDVKITDNRYILNQQGFKKMSKQNWFETLNASLESENLIELWDIYQNISYGQTFSGVVVEDGKNYRHISIYRNDNGLYERPTTYLCGKIKR